MIKVVIAQYRLLHYRVPLFQGLRSRCADLGIQLQLVHGQPTDREARKRDTGSLEWADLVRNRYMEIGQRDVLWQPFPDEHKDAKLIIFMQESRLLSNYPWLLHRRRGKPRIAYWGHGRNLQSNHPDGFLERWKGALVNKVDWWFAYTEMTRDILLRDGYPDERITVLDNAIDNEGFEMDLAFWSEDRLAALRNELCISPTSHVGLFCGSLYADKRLGFMVAAADRIRSAVPDFHLVVIGDGPNAHEIMGAAASRPWLHWVGVRQGKEKAGYFRLADVVFNPGAVGLHILDSLCAGVPLVTTKEAKHGPEIAYLTHGLNGLMLSGSAESYADAVIALLSDSSAHAKVRARAMIDSRRYTMKNMVENFARGIESCLAMEKMR